LYLPTKPTIDLVKESHSTKREKDSYSNIIDMGARWYSPVLGRFISPDSIVPRPGDPQSLNRYAYARNSPVSRLDPTGHGDIASDILDFIQGASMQYSDDVSWGAQSALNVDVKREFETNGSAAFGAGRQLGRVASTLQGVNETVSGGGMMGGGVAVGGGIAVLGCAGTALVGCPVAVGAGATLGGGMVIAGTATAVHGIGILAKVSQDPLPVNAWAAQSSSKPVRNSSGDPYPNITDPRTGKAIGFPEGRIERVAPNQRVGWGLQERGSYIAQWYEHGYATPDGGWEKYDIHHILPREFGGTNDFWNLAPVERETHKLFNRFWERYP
jgi:RHS repeat-associated protein